MCPQTQLTFLGTCFYMRANVWLGTRLRFSRYYLSSSFRILADDRTEATNAPTNSRVHYQRAYNSRVQSTTTQEKQLNSWHFEKWKPKRKRKPFKRFCINNYGMKLIIEKDKTVTLPAYYIVLESNTHSLQTMVISFMPLALGKI